jgi:hypothetical protein
MRKFLSSQKDTHPRTDWKKNSNASYCKLNPDLPRRGSLSKLTGVLNSVARPWLAASLACILLLLSGTDSAQTVVRSSASLFFDFWPEGQKLPAGEYLFDSEFPGSISIRGKGAKLSVAISLVLYADPVKKENTKLLFVRREENYYLIESVQRTRQASSHRRIRTSRRNKETNNEQREARLVYSWMGVSSHAIGIYCWRTKTKCIPVQSPQLQSPLAASLRQRTSLSRQICPLVVTSSTRASYSTQKLIG